LRAYSKQKDWVEKVWKDLVDDILLNMEDDLVITREEMEEWPLDDE